MQRVSESRAAPYFPELESLRGIAILLVFCFHTDGLVHFLFGDRPAPALPFVLFRVGGTGVDLFFVLSGFLLTLPFVLEAQGGRAVPLRHYFARRALRILPLYWTTVVFITLVSSSTARELLRAVPHLFFLSLTIGWRPAIFPHSTVWWSLVTEVQFYLLLPAVRWLLGRGARRRVSIGVLLGYGLLYLGALFYAAAVPPEPAIRWIWSSLLGRLPGFLCGIFGAWGFVLYGAPVRAWLHRSSWVRFGGGDAVLIALVIGLLLVLQAVLQEVVRVGWDVAEAAPFQVYHVAAAMLWTSIAGWVLLAPLWVRPLLHNRLFAGLGKISYSIYLWHVPVVHWSLMLLRGRWPESFHVWDLPTAVAMMGVAVVTVIVASLSYRFIEQPFLTYKLRLAG